MYIIGNSKLFLSEPTLLVTNPESATPYNTIGDAFRVASTFNALLNASIFKAIRIN